MKEQGSSIFRGTKPKSPGSSPWERDLKKLVRAQAHQWIVTAPAPFRGVLRQELRDLGFADLEDHGAGALVRGKAADIYPLLMMLKSGSRLFLLVDSFRAGAVEELYRKTAALPWELLLPRGAGLQIRVHLHHCRIEHEGAAGETLEFAIKDRLRLAEKAAPPAPPAPPSPPAAAPDEGLAAPPAIQHIELYGEGNVMELRLDACGEHLHRRGYRRLVSEAPIRESTAAALLLWYRQQRGPFVALHDPVCGSGTFPVEGWAISSRIPLSTDRDFALFRWPVFSAPSWEWTARSLREQAGSETPGIKPVISGADRDPAMIRIAEANAAAAGAEGAIQFSCREFFSSREPDSLSAGGRLLILNPPYGHRLAADAELPAKIHSHWKAAWSHWDLLILSPRETNLPKPAKKIPFENSGIAMTGSLYYRNGQES
jgi:23S rRNA G2445 N2-methylase RlmL